MKKQLTALATFFILAVSFYSCQKPVDLPSSVMKGEVAGATRLNVGITPYQFERINENNFYSQGWKEQQVNIVGTTTLFSTESDYVQVVCGPENNSDPRLIQGAVTMNLPTSADPTLRRIRLRKGGYSGTLLSDLTELKYSTYVVQNAPTIIVLQVDLNNDEQRDLNIYFTPRDAVQQPVALNTWQQWDALHGIWHIEATTIDMPKFSTGITTIPQLIAVYPNAKIIDTPPQGHNGEGVRFTIGGNPRQIYDNTIGYFDALIIGTKSQQHSTLFDFTCNQSSH